MPEASELVHSCLLLVVQSFRLLGKVLSSWYGRLQVKCKLVMLCDCQGGLILFTLARAGTHGQRGWLQPAFVSCPDRADCL